jgi:lysozyme family protein
MADVQKAVESVLREEDATLSGVVTDTKGDGGGKTRFGIASKFHPELVRTTFYTTMNTADALQVAILTMEKDYATPLHIGDIVDQALATKVLSFGVNAGVWTAAAALQRAVNLTHPGISPLVVDGHIGPETLLAVSLRMPVSLLNSFRLRMIDFYKRICRSRPSQLEFLCGWIDRALA